MKHLRRLLALALLPGLVAFAADRLERDFLTPPLTAKPLVWWHWMNGNVTRTGITADLEAMARVGVGGGIIFNVDGSAPAGPVRVMSPEWRELVQHAVRESARLGLELGLHNAPGWSSSGGTWNNPENGMQEIVTSEVRAHGPGRFDAVLPVPETALQTGYKEVAVVAFPTPAGETVKMEDFRPQFTVAGGAAPADPTAIALPSPQADQPQHIGIEFARPFTAQLLSFKLGYGVRAGTGRIEVSDDGRSFRAVDTFALTPSGRVQLHSFPRVTAKIFRVVFVLVSPRPRQIVVRELTLSPRRGVDNVAAKAFFSRAGSRDLAPDFVPEEVVARGATVDLTSRLDATGRLAWDVPAGDWTILRTGHAPTGQVANQPPTNVNGGGLVVDPLEHAIVNRPASLEGAWLECDKLSKAAIEAHWNGMMGPVAADAGPLAGTTLTTAVVDSFEIGAQNWTPGFQKEFQRRRGYDLLPWLPVLSGRVVGDPATTERFLWDYRRTIADLFSENYAGHFGGLAQRHGLRLEVEPYGNGSFDDLQYSGPAHVTLGEFWIEKGIDSVSRLAASVGHTYGQKVVGAEAFTAGSGGGNRWELDPFGMKALGDAAFCAGVNRYELHSYAHQPWLDRAPGMTLASVGTHFNRNVTWWEQGAPWLRYIARCQAVLQQGLFVADVVYFPGEALPSSMYGGHLKLPGLPAGYDFDACSAEVIVNRMAVKDGRIVLPDGMSYRLLVLNGTEKMSLPVLRKLKELADGGAVITGPRPVRTPGLTGYPQSEDELKRLADKLWGSGQVRAAQPLQELLQGLGVPPDFESGVTDGSIRYIHRTIGGAEVYFVSNQQLSAREVACTFRVSGRVPELWSADTGRIERAPVFSERDRRTTVPLRLDPAGSVFVVFRSPGQRDHAVSTWFTGAPAEVWKLSSGPDGRIDAQTTQAGTVELKTAAGRTWRADVHDVPAPLSVEGVWQLRFPSGRGAPEQVALERLISWTEHPDRGVNYFSGTATYVREIDIPADRFGAGRSLQLDLGEVKNLAEVKLNGRELGVLWKPPFRVDVTAATRPGKNLLEVKVTNLWPNRLIGDEQLPPDSQWLDTRLKSWPVWLLENKPSPTGRFTFATRRHWKKDDALLPSGLLGPVVLRTAVRVQTSANPEFTP